MEFFCINNFRYTTLPWLCQLFTVSKATDTPKSKESLFLPNICTTPIHNLYPGAQSVVDETLFLKCICEHCVNKTPQELSQSTPLPKWPCLCEETAEKATLTQKLWNRVDLEEVHQCADREHSPLFCGHPLRLSVLSPRQRTHFSSFLQPRFKSLEELIVQTFISILDSLPHLLQPSKHCNPQSHKLPLTCPSSWAL